MLMPMSGQRGSRGKAGGEKQKGSEYKEEREIRREKKSEEMAKEQGDSIPKKMCVFFFFLPPSCLFCHFLEGRHVPTFIPLLNGCAASYCLLLSSARFTAKAWDWDWYWASLCTFGMHIPCLLCWETSKNPSQSFLLNPHSVLEWKTTSSLSLCKQTGSWGGTVASVLARRSLTEPLPACYSYYLQGLLSLAKPGINTSQCWATSSPAKISGPFETETVL